MTLRVLIFVQHFYPSREIGARRPTELAKGLLAQNDRVNVIAAYSDLPWDEAHHRELAGLQLSTVRYPKDYTSRLWLWLKGLKVRNPGREESGARADDVAATGPHIEGRHGGTLRRWYRSFAALFAGMKLWTLACSVPVWNALRRNRYDVVITSTPPLTTAMLIRFMRAARVARFRWILDMRDPFVPPHDPDYSSNFRSALEGWVERSCFRDCDAIVVASPGIGADVAKRFPGSAEKIHVVYNGYDGQANLTPVPLAGNTLRLLSAGTIYFNRNPAPLLDAIAATLREGEVPRNAFHLTFLGKCEGPNRETLTRWVAERGLADVVELVDSVTPEEVRRYLGQAHVLVNFAQNQHTMIPAKTYEYIASGRESLTITEPDSETARVVARAACGVVTAPDASELASALRQLYRRYIERGERYVPDAAAVNEFSRDRQNARFLAICRGLTS